MARLPNVKNPNGRDYVSHDRLIGDMLIPSASLPSALWLSNALPSAHHFPVTILCLDSPSAQAQSLFYLPSIFPARREGMRLIVLVSPWFFSWLGKQSWTVGNTEKEMYAFKITWHAFTFLLLNNSNKRMVIQSKLRDMNLNENLRLISKTLMSPKQFWIWNYIPNKNPNWRAHAHRYVFPSFTNILFEMGHPELYKNTIKTVMWKSPIHDW